MQQYLQRTLEHPLSLVTTSTFGINYWAFLKSLQVLLTNDDILNDDRISDVTLHINALSGRTRKQDSQSIRLLVKQSFALVLQTHLYCFS